MRIGSIIYATRQGLGILAKQFYENGIIDQVLITHGSYEKHPEWYPPGTPIVFQPFKGPVFDKFLSEIDVLLQFETFYDWKFVDSCRACGITTVLTIMYEWTPRVWPAKPDKLICPSLLDLDYAKSHLGFPDARFLQIPVDTKYWKPRTKALRFLHSAGHIGHRNHKGTLELLKAIPYINSGVDLTIKAQSRSRLPELLREANFKPRDNITIIQDDPTPYDQQWSAYDVMVAPEKQNGLSLPLQEAYAAGMAVMTSDRYPHNTWLPKEPLIPVQRYEKACINSNYLEFDSAVVDPIAIASKINEWYGNDLTNTSESSKQWTEQNSWANLKSVWLEELAR